MSTPTLIILHGLPCTGKTGLARYLGSQLRIPVLSKDEIKEGLFEALGTSDADWSHRLSAASFAVIFRLAEQHISAGHSVIIEGNFHPDQHNYILAGLIARHKPRVVQVLCGGDGAVLQQRQVRRAESGERHPGHRDGELDPALWESLARGWEEPLTLPGALLLKFDSGSRRARQITDQIIEAIQRVDTGELRV